MSLIAGLTLETARRANGALVVGSEGRALSLGPSVAWKFSPHWTLETAVETGIFASGLGANRPGRIAISTGLRYGIF